MVSTYQNTCPCGRVFDTRNRRQRYCSDDCRDTARRQPAKNTRMHAQCQRLIATPPRENWRGWTDDEIATIRQMAGTATSIAIAAALGRTSAQVKHLARRYHISLRLHGERCPWAKYSNVLVEQARALHDGGMKPKQIAAQLDMPYWAVCDAVYYKRGLGYAIDH